MMVVMMVISGGVLDVVVDREKVLGEKNSPLLPHSSSKEDSLGPWAFMLLLREMIKENQKQPESLNWLPKEVLETQSSAERARGESGGKLRDGDLQTMKRETPEKRQMKRVFYEFRSVM